MSITANIELKDRLGASAWWHPVRAYLRYLLLPKSHAVSYGIQAALSVSLALFAAFYFQLESPFWAGAAALIVTNPVHGQVMAKGFSRLIGTFIGAAAAILLTMCFVQTTDVFVLMFALWIGLCVFTATMVRNLSSYAAALSGYTATLIVVGVISQPDHTLNLALARVAANICGIASTTLVSALLSRLSAIEQLEEQITSVIREAILWVRQATDGHLNEDFDTVSHRLIRRVATLDSLIEFAASESMEIQKRRADLQHIMANLMHALTATWALTKKMRDMTDADRTILKGFFAEAGVLLEKMSAVPTGDALASLGRDIGFFGKRYRQLNEELVEQGSMEVCDRLILIKNLGRAVDQLSIVMEGWSMFLSGETLSRRDPVSFDSNFKESLINGLRAFLAVFLSGLLWVETAWTDGASMMMMTAIGCSLFSSSVRPVMTSVTFALGGVMAFFLGIVAYLLVLPHIDGFPLLMTMLGTVTFFCFLHANHESPIVAMSLNSAAINLIMFMRFGNPMEYDFQGYLNRGVGQLFGMASVALVYVLVFPVLPRREIRRAVSRLLAEVRQIAKRTGKLARSVWESRMYDRLPRIISFLEMEQQATQLLLSDFFAVIHIGGECIMLQQLARSGKVQQGLAGVIHGVTDRLAKIGKDNAGIADYLTHSARQLFAMGEDSEGLQRISCYQVATTLCEISFLIGEHQQILIDTEQQGN